MALSIILKARHEPSRRELHNHLPGEEKRIKVGHIRVFARRLESFGYMGQRTKDDCSLCAHNAIGRVATPQALFA